jgi:hypothetical protein
MERFARINCILVPRDTFSETERNVLAIAVSLSRDLPESEVIRILNEMAAYNERQVIFHHAEKAATKRARETTS